MKALITGGSGYYGELLTRKLLLQGFECSILDINKPANDLSEKVTFHPVDIRNLDGVINATKGIDIVFHNVAQVPLAKNSKLFKEVNYIGTSNILKASLDNSVKKFIYTSSSAIYGVPKTNPVTEKTVPTPHESYGRAKLDGENEVRKYNAMGLDSVIIRPRTILGHGRLGIFQILFEWVLQNKKVPVFDNGKNIYQFVHADDLAEATIKSIYALKKEGDISYNIGCENYGSMHELLNTLINNVNSKSKIVSVRSATFQPLMKIASKLRLSPLGSYHALMYGKSMYFDINKAKNELNWQPNYSNSEMILESFNYYVSNRESILTTNGKTNSPHKGMVKQGILKLLNYFL